MANDIIVVERELLNSKVFRKLNGTEKTVYLDFLMKRRISKPYTPKPGRKKVRDILNNGEIEYCYTEAEKRGIPRATFMRAKDALIEYGFIDIPFPGNAGKKGDKARHSISDRWKAWGTDDFITASRPKDTRKGRGFQEGDKHWTRKGAMVIELETAKRKQKV